MSNRQIQPVRNRDIQIIRQARPRSLWGQVWNVALQPNTFFLALPQTPTHSRQWFWVAVLILALNGFSAVRQDALLSSSGGASVDQSFSQSTDFSSSGGGAVVQPGGFPSGPPIDFGTPPDAGTPLAASGDVSSTWVTALISATTILLGWFVLAVILCEIPLFNGVRPNFGQNLQLAIWTTVPLGIMAALQVIYIAATGNMGASGVSGLLGLWKGYNDLSPLMRSILLSLTSRMTIFWVWTLVLIFIGGRQALNGKVWAVLLVVLIWVLVIVMVPVATGAITATPVATDPLPDPIVLPEDSLPDNGVPLDIFNTPDPNITDDATGQSDELPTLEVTNSIFATPLPEENGEIATVEGSERSDEKDNLVSTLEPTSDTETSSRSPLATATP